MANFTNDKIQTVWDKAKTVDGYDKNEWRKDACDAWINKNQYGKEIDYGWEIDHILPEAKGGTDHTDNLRAFHWKNNRNKAYDFPDYTSAITSDGNINVIKEQNWKITEAYISILKRLYPDNIYLK